jgi:hypothetical protein
MEEDLKRFDIWNDVKKILNEKIIKEKVGKSKRKKFG